MSPKKRVEIALHGGHGEVVPFTLYEYNFSPCEIERGMRNRGMCIVNRMSVFKTEHPNVKIKRECYWENDKRFNRIHYETPVGNLSTLYEEAGFTSWSHEKMFKTPDDYKALLYYLKDERITPDYEPFLTSQKTLGDDFIHRAGFGLEPLQTLISSDMMKMEDFCIEWMDHRDEILKLYEALVENRRKTYSIVAKSPAMFANYGGNVVPEVIGLENFEKYYVQHYNEAAEIMHKHGKLIGCHFDANCRLLSQSIAKTKLDYIEAFTPAPDTDMTLGEARSAWPDKVIWMNFPSSVHLQADREVEQTAFDLLSQVKSVDGIILGITENIPEGRWPFCCKAVMDGLDRHAIENPKVYSA
jgi:hypothetical protein